ncbi:hypothetical protein RX327_09400 [Bradyrhizobium sp. BEA-2-5]|uniref:hypothetical protein n=1 Tax=Bradyrhizobium TaxID=374 RepID=UPI000484B659|nr:MULTISPECIES: hypothetical protein [Bradyrhizobium]WOH83326.1 hypothetical protein RX327_09400 [Bradyrhizobium sp. BEA-2-5]
MSDQFGSVVGRRWQCFCGDAKLRSKLGAFGFIMTPRIVVTNVQPYLGMTMRAKRVERAVGSNQSLLELLQAELAALNSQIEAIEKTRAETQSIDELRECAIRACRRIDEIRSVVAAEQSNDAPKSATPESPSTVAR